MIKLVTNGATSEYTGSIPFWQIYLFCLTVESGSYRLIKYVSSKLGCSQYTYWEEEIGEKLQTLENSSDLSILEVM
ncbi:MAG: hypothetical protein EA343_02985 [Nodularia sp. (in: Bacteria)]|nr:MAG: hypothetical protein EA343_02985 [Nodularia sp. (in: cyanobacteria)]